MGERSECVRHDQSEVPLIVLSETEVPIVGEHSEVPNVGANVVKRP